MTEKLKPYPSFANDEEEQAFLDVVDLSGYDLVPNGIPMGEWLSRFEQYNKDASLHLRLPAGMKAEIIGRAKMLNVPAQRLIRQYIERGLAENGKRRRG